jgi:hypothetical protein
MRSNGKCRSSAKRFYALMNMPPPPRPSAYQACNIALSKAVAVASISNAANKLQCDQVKEILKCAVLCDGT